MLSILLSIAIAAILAGAVAVGIKRIFPKRGDWLPVLCSTFLPPIVISTFTVFYTLVNLGKAAEQSGTAALSPVSFFLDSVSAYLFFAGIWLIVACPAAFAALHLFRRK
jgi:beta-lactamase regulating signal transducer with metallopeptidase domain